jgi:hypothetical protein
MIRTLLLAVVLVGTLRLGVAIVGRRGQGFVRRLKATRRVACVAGIVLAGAALTAYAIVIVYGWIAGYALPTVALFDVIPPMRRLATWEPNAPNALFVLAGAGATLEWLIHWGGIRLDSRKAKRRRGAAREPAGPALRRCLSRPSLRDVEWRLARCREPG